MIDDVLVRVPRALVEAARAARDYPECGCPEPPMCRLCQSAMLADRDIAQAILAAPPLDVGEGDEAMVAATVDAESQATACVTAANVQKARSARTALLTRLATLRAEVARLGSENVELARELADVGRLAEERLSHANQLQSDIEAEQDGRLALRKRLGAREDETFGAFIERLAINAASVPAEVHERGWQWRPVTEDTAFAPPFSTIRVCRGCDCLVAGGPTVCGRCAGDAALGGGK